VSTSEGETPMTGRALTTVGDSRVELGLSFRGLCSGSTTNLEEEQRNLGLYGSDNCFCILHFWGILYALFREFMGLML